MDIEEFRKLVKVDEITIDGDENWEGYTNQYRWNGWIVPWMEKDEVEKIGRWMDAIKERMNQTDDIYVFRWEEDVLVVDYIPSIEPEIYPPEEYARIEPVEKETPDSTKTLYPLELGWIFFL